MDTEEYAKKLHNESRARLHVIVAREANVAVVFRRGPTQWTQVIKWNLGTDTFDFGQWFRGRIFVEKCDISPSGKYLVYFAADWRKGCRKFGPTWTAVSRPPFLTALALWPEKFGTWNGGGHFITDHHLVVDTSSLKIAPGFTVPRKLLVEPIQDKNRDMIVSSWIYNTIFIDTELKLKNISYRQAGPNRTLIQGTSSDQLRKEYFFIREGEKDILIPNGQCLEVDHQDRTLVAVAGKLFVLPKERPFSSVSDLELIADLNNEKPREVVCPTVLRSWC